MKLLISWVRDFVDISVPARTIADRTALRGFEAASVEDLGNDEAVIDFEVTANRPDCLSVIGFAREIGTAFNLPVRGIDQAPYGGLATLRAGTSPDLSVTIEDAELCPRYAAAVADVTPAASPAWLTSRLRASGVRPISPFVDITNYVLMEFGHPMHAFDLATLAGREIRIRRAVSGESLTTLDGQTRTLEPDMLVIADGRRAQAVAGVMGGGHSEVSGATTAIAFESAYFKPASVRRTSKRLGLKTEASSRFERGADVNGAFVALRRAVALMQHIGAGTLRAAAIDAYPHPRGPLTIRLRRGRLARVLGLTVPDADVVRILQSLELEPTASVDGWDVVAPTFRVDLLREVDLIEEVGRHYGFDRLEATFPPMAAAAAPPDPRVSRDQLLRRVLTGAGVSEAVTFGFIEATAAEGFAPDGDAADIVTVANPLSAKFDVLRPSLLPGLLDAVARNRRHGRRDVALFEIGARFRQSQGETRGVALALTGAAAGEHWSAPARDVDFFDAKGIVERLGQMLDIALTFEPSNAAAFFVPGQAALILASAHVVGLVGVVTPALVDRAGAPRQDRIVAAELNLDHLATLQTTRLTTVTPLPRHPFVVRDVSIVVSDALPAEIIRGTIQAAGGGQPAPLVGVAFFDRYQGKGVPDGSVSISIRLTFQALDRTLTDAEVQPTFDTILAALGGEHAAVQR